MLKTTALSRGSSSTYNNRVFIYEVSGLAENDCTNSYIQPIRQSGSCFYQVPFSKMNQTMKRFNRLGGKIISIKPMESFNAAKTQSLESADEEGN